MLSMPRGTDAKFVQCAAREFAAAELAGHRYVMVLHNHQANPHVHLSVRATGRDGSRLNPRKADLHRWRETFAEKLRGYGIEAEATRQATRGETRRFDTLWRVKAKDEGRLLTSKPQVKSGAAHFNSRSAAFEAWMNIANALMSSDQPDDHALAAKIQRFGREAPFMRDLARHRVRERERQRPVRELQPSMPQRTRLDIEMER
jgi:hypothetical protein